MSDAHWILQDAPCFQGRSSCRRGRGGNAAKCWPDTLPPTEQEIETLMRMLGPVDYDAGVRAFRAYEIAHGHDCKPYAYGSR